MSHRRGAWLLVLLTLVWGTTFVVIKQALPRADAGLLTASRFLIASLFFLPFLRGHWPWQAPRLWLVGLELGLWLAIGYGTQAVGLHYTSVGRSAFITTLHVIFVPLIAAALGQRIPRVVWIAAVLAFAGTGLLCFDGGPANVGDAWTVLCALAWAVFIYRLGVVARRWAALPLTAVQLLGVTFFCLLWVGWGNVAAAWTSAGFPWAAILYLGVAATAVTTWLQTLGQRTVAAPQAAVIFTLEPVWAALFAVLVLGEWLGPQGMAGAALILLATLLCQWRRERRTST